jgi:hypothetical protein
VTIPEYHPPKSDVLPEAQRLAQQYVDRTLRERADEAAAVYVTDVRRGQELGRDHHPKCSRRQHESLPCTCALHRGGRR